VDYCKGIISDLLQNRIDLSLLVITKGLGKKTSNGSGKNDEEGTGQKTTSSGASYQAR